MKVTQLLQGRGGRRRGRVALLHKVREVTDVTVVAKPVALGVATSPLFLSLAATTNKQGDTMMRI